MAAKRATKGDPYRAPGQTGVLCRFDGETLARLDALVRDGGGVRAGERGRGPGRRGGRVEVIRRLISAAYENRPKAT